MWAYSERGLIKLKTTRGDELIIASVVSILEEAKQTVALELTTTKNILKNNYYQITELKSQLTTLETELITAKSSCNPDTTAELQTQITILQGELTASKTTLIDNHKQVTALEEQLVLIENELNLAQQTLLENDVTITSLKTNITSLQDQLTVANSTVTSLETQILNCTQLNQQAKTQYTAQTGAINQALNTATVVNQNASSTAQTASTNNQTAIDAVNKVKDKVR